MTGEDGDILLERIVLHGDDEAANDLLGAIRAGYSLDRLRLLLRSEKDDAVRAGAWIVSELGADAAPLREELPALLRHGMKYVRFFGVDAVLSIASAEDGALLAAAVALIDDSEEAVRWKVLGLLSRATRGQLEAAVPWLTERDLSTHLVWLLDEHRGVEDVMVRLGGSRLDRMFAVAAAVRLSGGRREALQRAATSDDREVASFARETLAAS